MCFSRFFRRTVPYPQELVTEPAQAYPVTAVFLFMGEIPSVEARVKRLLHWQRCVSGLRLAEDFCRIPEVPIPGDGLGPAELPLQSFQTEPFIFCLYASPSPKNAWTWPLYDWRHNEQPCTVATVPYVKTYSDEPFGGFITWMEQQLAHEIKNSLISWLNQGLGYSLINTYECDGEWIDCGQYPKRSRYTDCYMKTYEQLTDEMRRRLAAL